MLQEDEVFEKYEGTQAQLRADISEAQEKGDWVRVLALLRRGPQHIPKARLAALRARAYQELGHADTARLFQEYAAKSGASERPLLAIR